MLPVRVLWVWWVMTVACRHVVELNGGHGGARAALGLVGGAVQAWPMADSEFEADGAGPGHHAM